MKIISVTSSSIFPCDGFCSERDAACAGYVVEGKRSSVSADDGSIDGSDDGRASFLEVDIGDGTIQDGVTLGVVCDGDLTGGCEGDSSDCEVIVLAQASMAHMEKAVAEHKGLPTFSSPALCVAQLKAMMEE